VLELETTQQPAVTSSADDCGLTSRHHPRMKRCDGHLQLPQVAAADTSLTQFSSEAAGRHLTERERIKRAKHNGGITNCSVRYQA